MLLAFEYFSLKVVHVCLKTQDAELLQKFCTVAVSCTKRQTITARKVYEYDVNEGEENEEQANKNEAKRDRKREERRQKALERKLAQWKANKYTSAAIDISEPDDG